MTLITEHLQSLAADHAVQLCPDITRSAAIGERLRLLATQLQSKTSKTAKTVLTDLLHAAKLSKGSIDVQLNVAALALAIGQPVDALNPDKTGRIAPFNIRRRGIETKIIAGSTVPEPDPTLRRVLAKAHLWVAATRSGVQIAELAREHSHSESYISSRAVLAFLSPKIQAAILAGAQPVELTTDRLGKSALPSDCREQETLLGFFQKKHKVLTVAIQP